MAKKYIRDNPSERLFADPQRDLFEKSYEEKLREEKNKPVECLGMTFENDEKRREHFMEKLHENLKDPEFRKIEGFPIGEDEDILALSDPPYYTACPNPFIVDFIDHYGKPYDPTTDGYRREPFAADVSEGKNDPIYNAHSYHTKVPHKAIMRYILHYTEPGDVVFDGFCGTGMTGVAAQLCGDKATIESLGYKVESDEKISGHETDENGKTILKPFSKLGARHAILNDLSPAATFISYNYNTPVDIHDFEKETKRILKEVEAECGWMYETLHNDGKTKAKINYTVFSDVFICPECTREVVFWEAAVNKKTGKVLEEFPCPQCGAIHTKRNMDRAWVTKFDKTIKQTVRRAKQVPVLINYKVGKQRYEKKPDSFDLNIIDKIENSDISSWFPTIPIQEGDKTGEPLRIGITHVHQFYTKRNLLILSSLHEKLASRPQFVLLFQSQLVNLSLMNRYRPHVSFPYNPLGGTLYIASQISEADPITAYWNKIKRLVAAFKNIHQRPISECCSSTQTLCPSESVDYIFTDPPFGGNLMYSELNFIWEAWLKVLTNSKIEAIQNVTQGKSLFDYQEIMTRCFQEYHRVLKPGRWMTVEFHNSKNSVWNSIQEALQHAGFVVADVRTLDKRLGTFNQVAGGGAVKQDLIISAYKPNAGLEERFKIESGTEDGVWDFVRTHLKQLPVFVSKDGQTEVIAERQNYLLFDRMVAFHVQRGVTVPLSAAEFYVGLEQRFPPRDGMYFLPDQAAEYDKKRITVKEVLQLELFVSDEASAIQWLKQQLTKKPQSFQDIHPQFIKEIGGWQKHEKPLELSELLKENFLCYDGKYDVPSQIHSYLSSNFKELRNLEKADPALKIKAKDRWYVPDPNKAGDLEKLRERALLREFEEYRESKQKRLKVFRLEAVRAGFKKAWQERDYATIISVARKIPENILQEDPKLLMWYDQAITRMGEGG
jgi:DNA modification methylase